MHAEIATQWADALRATPRSRRHRQLLRTNDERMSPLGVLASITTPHLPKVKWHLDRFYGHWALVPLVGAPSTTMLVPDLARHCAIATGCDPHFQGRLSIYDLGSNGMSFESLAELILKYHQTL